jgi:hypothetical protein
LEEQGEKQGKTVFQGKKLITEVRRIFRKTEQGDFPRQLLVWYNFLKRSSAKFSRAIIGKFSRSNHWEKSFIKKSH